MYMPPKLSCKHKNETRIYKKNHFDSKSQYSKNISEKEQKESTQRSPKKKLKNSLFDNVKIVAIITLLNDDL